MKSQKRWSTLEGGSHPCQKKSLREGCAKAWLPSWNEREKNVGRTNTNYPSKISRHKPLKSFKMQIKKTLYSWVNLTLNLQKVKASKSLG